MRWLSRWVSAPVAAVGLLPLLTGCGLLFGECIVASAEGVVESDQDEPLAGALLYQCSVADPDDCSEPTPLGTTEEDGSFEVELEMSKQGFGCQAASLLIEAEGCTPRLVHVPLEFPDEPIQLDCPGA